LKAFLTPPSSVTVGVADDGVGGGLDVESQPTSPVTTTGPARRPTLANLRSRVVNRISFSIMAAVEEDLPEPDTFRMSRQRDEVAR